MPTVTVDVNAISGDTGHFNVNSATVLARASDGDTGTTFFNTSGNKSLTFGLEDVSDIAGISGATLNSLLPVVTAAAGGKGAMEFTIELVNSDGVVNGPVDGGSSNGTQLDYEGETANLSTFTQAQFNDLSIRYTTTNNTQPIVSRVRAVLEYTVAVIVNPGFSLSNAYLGINGEMNLDSGQINLN